MRILFTSDWHVDASTAGVERIDELAKYVDAVVDAVRREGVDLVCFLGDAFDPGSLMEARWSTFMVRAARRLADTAALGAIFIPGNHDVLDVSEPISTLSPLAAAFDGSNRLVVCELPEFVTMGFAGQDTGVGVLALPYVSRAVERAAEYRHAFDAAIAGARAAKRGGRKVVAIGHYTIAGIEPGSEGEMVRGRDLMFPAHALRGIADLVVNGHYHARQTVTVDGVRVEIVGAPVRFTFGERDDGPRGFLLAEV